MNDEVSRLLAEIADAVKAELENEAATVRLIVRSLEVDEEEYAQIMVREVINSVNVEAMFAFPPLGHHTPEAVKEKAMKVFKKNFERDKRLFLKK